MLSTFHGLETARRALNTQQSALYTTGHNIANANTVGYSQQRVNFTQTEAFPNPAFNKPGIPGQLGTGVKAGEIQRVRESFLDVQFRNENTSYGFWSTRSTALERMEDIMNEPTENGLAQTIDRFWGSLEDLSINPEDSGARSVVRQNGMALAEQFNTTYSSLETIQRDYGQQLDINSSQVNSVLRQINELNEQIARVEPHGFLPNDLYDKRDLLVDELSMYVNINVTRIPTGGNSSSAAEGKYSIDLVDSNGQSLDVKLIDGENLTHTTMSITKNPNAPVESINFGETSFAFDSFNSSGALRAMVQAYGYLDAEGNEKGTFNEMMQNLDTMAFTFAAEFNRVHNEGWSIMEINSGTSQEIDFFAYKIDGISLDNPKGAAKELKVSDDIRASLNNIAAAQAVNGQAFAGDGSNALRLADVKDSMLLFGDNSATIQSFYQGVIGQSAVETREANRMTANTDTLRASVEERRKSVSSVSLDEEMVNMIRFQHAYNAAARSLNAVDEMLDKIINGMGLVGR